MHSVLCLLLCFAVAVSGAAISNNQQYRQCGLLSDSDGSYIASCTSNDAPCCGPDFTCGSTSDFCNPYVCNSDYGVCDISEQDKDNKPEQDKCGIFHWGSKCSEGKCCGSLGTCGLGDAFCSLSKGCQPNYGLCYPESYGSASLNEIFGDDSGIYESLIL